MRRTDIYLPDTQLDALLPLANEYLPPEILKLAGVPPLRDALRMLHRPKTIEEGLRGRERLAFEEMLFMQILHRKANALKRQRRKGIVFTAFTARTTAAPQRPMRQPVSFPRMPISLCS